KTVLEQMQIRAKWKEALHAGDGIPLSSKIAQDGQAALKIMASILLPIIRDRRENPRNDLISALWRRGPGVFPDWNENDVLSTCWSSLDNEAAPARPFVHIVSGSRAAGEAASGSPTRDRLRRRGPEVFDALPNDAPCRQEGCPARRAEYACCRFHILDHASCKPRCGAMGVPACLRCWKKAGEYPLRLRIWTRLLRRPIRRSCRGRGSCQSDTRRGLLVQN